MNKEDMRLGSLPFSGDYFPDAISDGTEGQKNSRWSKCDSQQTVQAQAGDSDSGILSRR